ncbi:dockerin type I repeat-containing protein [Acholeplasma hippikon]|nr:dockerin type I repeat-containing protein [Acholeplasma hippikon]
MDNRYNTRTNLYYDVSVLENYKNPRNQKPSITVGGQGLLKTSMFEDGLKNRGFSENFWVFTPIEGMYAYYPQLKIFNESQVEEVVSKSILSVRTNAFIGDGTKASPYLISTVQDLINLSSSIGKDFTADGVYYLVGSNISTFDLANTQFKPIGSEAYPFNGHFDGNYANFNLKLNNELDYQALFGSVGQNGSVKRLSVTGHVTGKNYIGSIVGKNEGLVEEVYAKTNIQGTSYVGGLIGRNEGTLRTAYFTGSIEANGSYIGGIAGENTYLIDETYVSASVLGQQYVGAILGYNLGEINKSYYNQTLITYLNPGKLSKPTYAVSNELDTFDVLGLEKEKMFTLNDMSLSSFNWMIKETTGMYNYFLQIKGFGNNVNATIKTNAQLSVRVIRFKAGEGTESNPYLIENEFDMKTLSDISKEETLDNIYFKVIDGVTQIDLSQSSLNFNPIGSSSKHFKGHFDGNHTSFILDFNRLTSDYLGLFGYIENAKIKNLTILGKIIGRDYIAALAGYALNSEINNVSNKAVVQGRSNIAGLIGYADQVKLNQVYNRGNIKGSTQQIGGILGYSVKSTLYNVYNDGLIEGNRLVGGLIGNAENQTKVTNAYNKNHVYGQQDYVGGLFGYINNGQLNQAYSAGYVRGKTYLGGLIGRMSGISTIKDAYYDETIIESDNTSLSKPTSAVSNLLNQETVRGVLKADLIGGAKLSLPSEFIFKENENLKAFYPELLVFYESENKVIRDDSYESTMTHIFAGEGTISSPYLIVNEFDMVTLSRMVKEGFNFKETYFKVRENKTNFNLTNESLDFEAIGSIGYPFEGIFDGNGANFELNIIKDLNDQGLFGYLGLEAVVKNLSVSGLIKGNNYVGLVAGRNFGQIDTVHVKGELYGKDNLGTIIGHNAGTLTNAYSISTIYGESIIGGLVGLNTGTIKNTYSATKISGKAHVGALIGINEGTLQMSAYNEEILQMFELTGYIKVTHASSNEENSMDVKALNFNQMYSGTLTDFTFDDSNTWVTKAASSFEVYYPQLKYFAGHKNANIVRNSLQSVTALRFKQGEGTEKDPYIIRNEDDMQAVSDLILSGQTLKGIYFKVDPKVSEINLDNLLRVYVPIGNENYKFEGNFDGSFVTFVINHTKTTYYEGIFGYIGKDGVVHNFSVEGSLKGTRFVGAIAGRNLGTILNVYNLAKITSTDAYAGGITGYNEGKITHAYNLGDVEVITYDYAGGISGFNTKNGVIENSFNRSLVKARYYVGGLIGYNQGNLFNSYAASKVTGEHHLGGAIGYQESGKVDKVYYDLSVQNVFNEKVVRALSNVEDSLYSKGVTTLSLTYQNENLFDENIYVFKLPDGFNGYYPELKIFKDHENEIVSQMSFDASKTNIYQGYGSENHPYFFMDQLDITYLEKLIKETKLINIYFKVFKEKETFNLNNFKTIGSIDHHFEGHIDFNQATLILNQQNGQDELALFHTLTKDGSLKNVNLTGTLLGKNYVAGLVLFNEGLIHDVTSTMTVKGKDYVGGIISINDGIVHDVFFKGKVESTGRYTAGIVSYQAKGDIYQVYNLGEISSTSNYVAGITAYNGLDAVIHTAFNDGKISTKENYAAGIATINFGFIENAYNANEVSANHYVAGIAATNEGHIKETYHYGNLIAKDYVAGIVVSNLGTVSLSYYDKESVVLKDFNLREVESAIFKEKDTIDVKGLFLKQMTGLQAIGNNDEQMDFNPDKYVLRDGFDFTSHYPELKYFNEHKSLTVRNDSYQSVLDQKLLGQGTKENPYIIYDGYDMLMINDFVIKGYTFKDKYFMVSPTVNLIDLSLTDLNYRPIGDAYNAFEGNFDGNKKTFILNMNLSEENLGIFHTLGKNAVVHDFKVTGTIIGLSYVGTVASRNEGYIYNIENYANVKSISINQRGGNSIGGIVSVNAGQLENVTNHGKIEGLGSFVGGIAGENDGSIKASYNKGIVSGPSIIGGITGINRKQIKHTYNMAQITATVSTVGGIAGENNYIIEESFNNGTIISNKDIAGGLVGLQSTTNAILQSVYNTAKVYAYQSLAGGIIGKLDNGLLIDSYQTESVYSQSQTGLIVGQFFNGNVSNSYYDLSILNNHNENNLFVGTKAFGDFNLLDTLTVKGLDHSRMIGLNSLNDNQIKFTNKALFVTKASFERYSYYVQIKFFTNHTNYDVVSDSILSVQTHTFKTGLGTETDPYIIKDEIDMILLSDTVNSGNTYKNTYFKVDPNKINFILSDQDNTYKFNPIGNKNFAFEGIFDGSYANFELDLQSNVDYQALFGHVGSNGSIKNLSVTGIITGKNYTASIIGKNLGKLETSYAKASVTGVDNTGGLVGYNEGIITNVYHNGRLLGRNYVGNISGYNKGTIKNTISYGVIYGENHVGTVIGYNEKGNVENNYYDLTVLSAYSNYQQFIKPTDAISNDKLSSNIGLVRMFMIGLDSLGTSQTKMNLDKEVWSNNYNIFDFNNYPQLKAFARHENQQVKNLSYESTRNELYTVTLDFMDEELTYERTVYVLKNEYYSLTKPFKYGHKLEGWYLNDGTKLTDDSGLSLKPFEFNENIHAFAKYELQSHKVRFIDGDGKIIDELEVLHGGKARASIQTPTKNKTSTKVYEFINWNFDFDTVILKSTDIYANYKEINRYFEVTYLDGDSKFFRTEKAEYDTELLLTSYIPTKTYDEFAYKFVGWDTVIIKVKENLIIYSIFESVPRYYEIRFHDSEGFIYQIQTIEYGSNLQNTDLKVTKQSTVSHDFIFTSWDKDLSFIDKNLDVYPIFEEKLREYEVKFIDGNGKLFESQKVKYGTYPKPIENEPRKASVGLVAYKFIGLDKAFELVTGPKTYYAVFEEIPRYSEVRFIDGNGKICFTTTTEYLFDSKLPEFIPSKAPTDKYAYTFVKWEDNYKEIREDTTVYAVFSEDLRPFTVTFLDGDGFIHETQIVRYGMNASAPTQPRKTPIGNIAYQFVSWDHSLSHITSDVTIKPSFIEVPRYYQVIFTDYTGELILKTEIVEYLEGATPPLVPERTHTNEKYEYVFTSWSEDITKIIQDIVVKPIYEERVKTYQITLVNGDEIQTLTLAHGSSYMLYEGKKTSTDKISYEFIGWKLNGNFVTELKNVTSNLTLYAEFNEVHHYFVVNFLDGNGELFEVVYVNKNEILQYPTKTPTKQKTADYIYVFKAWDKVLTIIEEDTTIYPIFDTYQRFNEVNFFDAYGNLIKSEIVEYGKAATLPAQPIKRETEMYRYEFQGWNKNISNIQRDTDVYPVYKELLREFSVNFYDGNNLVYQSFLVTYGTSINQNFETTKTPTSDTYFIFSYWDKPTDFITNDLNIYPIFEEVSRYYDVTFIYLDINEVETSLTLRVEYRKDAYDPRYDLPIILISDTKVKAIAGWDSELTNVKENRVIYAQYEIFDKYHEVRFFVDDTLVLNVLASYGEDITPSISPTKEQTVYERYKFIGWDKDLNYITSSMDVYAVFETLSNRLTITFLDGDGNIFDVLEVMYGTDLSNYDGIPEKRPTKEFTYMFIGWDKDLTWVERDLIVIPRFEEKVRYYQVIFLDQHGQTLKVETLAYGKRATAPTNYQVPLDDETYRYEARFNKPFDYITEDLIVELEIIKLLRLYQVTIYDALGEVYERLALPYGEEIILPTEMHKASSPQYNYIFIGWDNEELIVTKDTSFTPLFSESLRYYLVTYVDGDENIICEELVPYQGNGTIPGIIPTKIDNQMYRYEFRMWDKKPINITKDTTIYAVFNQYLKQYTVTFLDEFDNVILIQEVLYGQGAIEPSLELIPMKPSTNTFDYVYAGWDKQFNRITEDTVLRIRYLAVLRLYTYTFYDDDHTTILKEVKGQYGIEIIAPIVSDKRIGENVYRFVSWNKALDSYLERDVEFFAIYELKPSLYTVNFYDDNRNIISTQYIEHGKQAIAPNQPLKTQTDKYEYIFLAWSRSFERVEENLDIYPLYEERIRQFKVKFNYEKEVLLITKSYGESINVNELKIPTKLGHHFVKWDQSLTFITKDLEVNPIFEKNTYEIVYIVHDADSGAMEHQIVSYLEQVTLYKNLFKKKGYEFKGWKLTLDGDVVSYNDLETFTYTLTDNLYLYAHFEAIQFEVIYDSDGGTVLEKDFYTIEKGVAILPTPVKPNHIFIGWVLEDIILPEENLMRILNFGVEDKGTIVTEISEGLIGTIMLKARYQYNGYIRIKEAYQDINQLVYADVTSIIPIIERTNDENIVYFIGLKPNETLAEIKERIENPEFDFVDNKGNIITDLNQIVKTGISLIVRDQNYPEEILDEVILVLKGDINGDGKINSIDYNSILNHISNRVPIEKASLIAALINADDKVNVTDLNVLLNYINGKTNIFA